MTKQEFTERVSKIAENLTEVSVLYQQKKMYASTFKEVVGGIMSFYPYDWYMADDIDEECAGLTRGEVYKVGDGEEWDVIREKKDFVAGCIKRIENWEASMFDLTGDGVPFFVTRFIGFKGQNY